jgi:RNA recognition motif-containing protein
MNIYVGNLDKAVKKTALLRLFKVHGKVVKASIARDKDSGASRGFAFVEMGSDDEGEKAIIALNDEEFMGQKLQVSEARESEKQQRTTGKRGGERPDQQQRGSAYHGRMGGFNRSGIGQRGGKRGG